MDGLSALAAAFENRFHREIAAHQVLQPVDGEYAQYPARLDARLAAVLQRQGITKLYGHQAAAFELISQNRDTVLVSHTASGKTLSFLLPILNEYLAAEAPFSVLLLYPTKALSRDQESTLGRLLQTAGAQVNLGTFDGDTPRDERVKIQRSADFIITNPDMLHSGIMPNHNRKWRGFLSRLRYVVVDEVHVYRGAFGSHVANVFRRLQRICEIHGSRPAFVCSSATVDNPGEHVKALFQRPVEVIDRDSAPRPRRDLYLVNPPLARSHGHALYRKGPGSVSVPLLRLAATHGVRTICFCRGRQEVERLYKAVIDRQPGLRDVIKPYRGGLLPNERRQLERDLASGRLRAIITTNALELGIDIGNLELCILSGHPGSMASFWQQSGRVGRKGNGAVIVFIARDTPIDQYFVHHPEFLERAPIEKAWLSADNPYILLQHLPCAAHEHPLRTTEARFVEPAYREALAVLQGDETLKPWRNSWRYAGTDFPTRGVNLRGMTDYNIEIYCGAEVIGELDPIGARGTVYKDAIYQHLGRRYMSMELDLEKKLCRVEPVNVDYFTDAVWENRLEMTEVETTGELHRSQIDFGYVHVNLQPKLYKKIRERSFENIGYGPITLAPFEYDTMGLSLIPARHWQQRVADLDKRFVGAALHGLSYILKRTAPSVCMADIRDLHTDVSLTEVQADNWRSALYLYDAIEGGVGYAEKVYEDLRVVLQLCERIICECECRNGCPACVPPLPPGVSDEDLEQLFIESDASVICTRSLLRHLIDEELLLPQVTQHRLAQPAAITPPGEDAERLRLQSRLGRAAKVLQKKRERLH